MTKGLSTQKFYSPDSYQVQQIPTLLTNLALFSLLLSLVGIPFIKFNYFEEEKGRNSVMIEIDPYLPQLEDKGPSDYQGPKSI